MKKEDLKEDNYFIKMLSETGDNVLLKRAKNISNRAELEMSGLVSNLEKDVLELEARIANLEDLSVCSKDSLTPAEGFDPKAWVEEIQGVSIELEFRKAELKVARGNYKKYFG